MNTIVSVVGARPQFVKLAPIADAGRRLDVNHIIIHTGQHYDANMSDVFFSELGIPNPDIHLEVGSGGHGKQTGRILERLESVLLEIEPSWVLAYGDTNSTIAAALAAVKLQQPLAHLEAGLRSFNRSMPEEHNRVLTDHASDLLLCPSPTALVNLAREGLEARSVLVGDVMVDVTLKVRRSLTVDELEAWAQPIQAPFVLATLHRAENTDCRERLAGIVEALHRLGSNVVLAAHPRLRARAEAFGLELGGGNVTVVDPLPYRSLIAAVSQSVAVVTDSGGLQKEAHALKVPCTTVRTETEWIETLENGWNRLCPDVRELGDRYLLRDMTGIPHTSPYGDGRSAETVMNILQCESGESVSAMATGTQSE